MTMPGNDIRWRQRFEHFENALRFLEEAMQLEHPSRLEKAGALQAFEFTFELAWKMLKDYLEAQGVPVKMPRETLKAAFSAELISDGHVWIAMLDSRNAAAHTYDEEDANALFLRIKSEFLQPLQSLYAGFASR